MSKYSSVQSSAPASAVYGLGFLGALIYYLTTASGIVGGLIGILKAMLWPAFLVYEVMKYLGM